ncbi:sensor histidine kinase [Mycobacterium vicinigordonae]|uniref:Sensor histidine kinase n=1 Tax=Mycobacterium vicinigordonae TaxID=1719132 RepID=A0A7D6E087_9MYCO|nr:ATP-binding protein [Mycobacterium vicinigordonae]QLL05286.1 sensor histidine kinase [Mycobacterium vicinigordonae]
MSSTEVGQVLRRQRLRSLQGGSLLRVGVVVIMLGAMLQRTDPVRWPAQAALLGIYAVSTGLALVLAFSGRSKVFDNDDAILAFALVDVVAVFGFKLLSPGGYMPLLVMALLPRLVAVELSLRRAAVVLGGSMIIFTASVLQDDVITPRLGPTGIVLIVLLYAFVCGTALLVVIFRLRNIDDMVRLTTSREELLAETMTTSEAERRQISEAIHDGPLQDVLAARRDVADYLKVAPEAPLQHALASLHDASRQLRAATFELHPAVLDQVGLAAAVKKLAAVTQERSGIAITTDCDYPGTDAIDPILFGAIRELLSNVVRHSGADTASVHLAAADGVARIDVVDNGVGITGATVIRRLSEGHIGLASQRARVEAAGGTLRIIDDPTGARLRVEVPLRG